MHTAEDVLAWLKRRGTEKQLREMERYGVIAPRAFGVPFGELKKYAKQLGTNRALAAELWESGWYEARMLAAFIDDAREVTEKQMKAWARQFDNWGIVDTVCFALFDRAPAAWKMIQPWAKAKPEFEKRAAYALIWSLTVHDKKAPDQAFLDCIPLIETGATDGRHFVTKAISMALRAIGKRNRVLHTAALQSAERLSNSEDSSARSIGKEALRELRSASVLRRVGGK